MEPLANNVTRLHPKTPPLASQEDAQLWGRVRSHLNDDIPLPVLLLGPWRWLNTRARRRQAGSRAGATIHPFPFITWN